MTASILIIILSIGLIAYWLRYTCLLLLSETEANPASFPLFAFPRVRARLAAGPHDVELRRALDRDYAVLCHLIARSPLPGLEARLLVWDYRLLCCWYALARAAFPERARLALVEMADVLGALAARLRENTAPAA